MKFNRINVSIGENVSLGKDVKIGDNSVIYDNVTIGDGTIIANNCIIGEPSTDYYYDEQYQNRQTVIGKNCLIRSHAIIYNGNTLGDNITTGHRVILRESNRVGNNCRIGNLTELHGNVVLGRYVRLHSNICIVENAIIGDFVWISPGTIFTNDATPPSTNLVSPIIGDYTFIAVNTVLFPGIKVGKHCLIGPNTSVTKDVPDQSFVLGNPGRIMPNINEFSNKKNDYYPWPFNYEKGMPWEGIGYAKWLEEEMKQDKR